MNVQELRMGNRIEQGVVHNAGYSMGHSGYHGVYVLENEFSSGPSTFYKYDEIKPIPLTEEWLIKFGFERSGNEWHGLICLEIRGGKVSYSAGMGVKLSNDIFYVHQLQNLYFALTEKELTIKK